MNTSSQSLCDPATRSPGAHYTRSKDFELFASAISSCNSHIDGGGNIVFPKDISRANMPVKSAQVQVHCSDGVKYEIGWNQGNSPVSGRRGMKCATANTCRDAVVQYDVFKDAAATQVWGNQWLNKNSIFEGENDGAYTAYVAVYKDQPYPAMGTYRDTVVATVMVTSTPDAGVPVVPNDNPWADN